MCHKDGQKVDSRRQTGGSHSSRDVYGEYRENVNPSTRVFLLTDGEDTETSRTSIPVDVDSNRDLVHREVHTSTERRTAVIDFLEKVASCDVHILGIGNEVKDLVTALSSKKMVVGHVQRGVNARHMIGIVKTVMAESPSSGLITPDYPRLLFPTEEEQSEVCLLEKNILVSDDQALDAISLEVAMQECEASLSLPPCNYTRAVGMVSL